MSNIDENLIATLEQSLRQAINAQKGLVARLREVEEEGEKLRQQIEALEATAEQTAKAIESVLSSVRPEAYSSRLAALKSEVGVPLGHEDRSVRQSRRTSKSVSTTPVTYIGERAPNSAPPSHGGRFSDRTITQACTLILREYGTPLHVNELYQILLDGGMEFTGNNPTISIAVSLNRNRRFCKVAPGTFDLVIKDASQAAS